jgi:FKBP-type peptidyl-prolyl cis-trans isomerase
VIDRPSGVPPRRLVKEDIVKGKGPGAKPGDTVIEGWEKGLVGIKEGGRRKLIIPPEQAYGAQGAPPSIGPNETLVFVIDALAIQGE